MQILSTLVENTNCLIFGHFISLNLSIANPKMIFFLNEDKNHFREICFDYI